MAVPFSPQRGQQASWRAVKVQRNSYILQFILRYSPILHKEITVEERLPRLNLHVAFCNMYLWPFFIQVNTIHDQVTFK